MPRLLPLLLSFIAASAIARELPPMADIHLHWKWNQKEVTGVEQAISALDENGVELAVVIGTPPELALELSDADPRRIIPIWSPYRLPGHWSSWHRDPELLVNARRALEHGYRGIGELHMIGGFISDWRKPSISGLFSLAAEYDVPVLVHTEFSRADYLIGFCRGHPKTRFLLAHAGSLLKADEVRRALLACPNLWLELSARDPWRHVRFPIADRQGHLLPEWRQLVLDFADRTMTGSDPVWPVDRLNAWDEPDTGWREIGRFLDFHRGWIEDLPEAVREPIRIGNARRLFGAIRH